MSGEMIEIQECPLCKKTHTYRLKVERSVVIKNMMMSGLNERPGREEFTRLFVCPVKGQEFQATFFLYDTSYGSITSVEVVGLA